MWLKLQRYCRSRKVRTNLLRSSKLAFNVQVKTLYLSVVVVVNFSHFKFLLQNKCLKLKTIQKLDINATFHCIAISTGTKERGTFITQVKRYIGIVAE